MSQDDLDFVEQATSAIPNIMRYYPKCYSRDELRPGFNARWIANARHGHGLWLVSEKATRPAGGQVGILVQNVRGVDEKEVGYLSSIGHFGGAASPRRQPCGLSRYAFTGSAQAESYCAGPA